MRVLHIIPAAFEYFEDIQKTAFAFVEKLDQHGLYQEIFTLQYGELNRSAKNNLNSSAPSRNFKGLKSIETLIDSLSNFDIIHLHTPFLGAAGKILKWKKEHPEAYLVVTYYRSIKITDLFSWLVRGYNYFYLPKIFRLANCIISFKDLKNSLLISNKIIKKKPLFFLPLTNSLLGVQLEKKEQDKIVKFFIQIYNKLVN